MWGFPGCTNGAIVRLEWGGILRAIDRPEVRLSSVVALNFPESIWWSTCKTLKNDREKCGSATPSYHKSNTTCSRCQRTRVLRKSRGAATLQSNRYSPGKAKLMTWANSSNASSLKQHDHPGSRGCSSRNGRIALYCGPGTTLPRSLLWLSRTTAPLLCPSVLLH